MPKTQIGVKVLHMVLVCVPYTCTFIAFAFAEYVPKRKSERIKKILEKKVIQFINIVYTLKKQTQLGNKCTNEILGKYMNEGNE